MAIRNEEYLLYNALSYNYIYHQNSGDDLKALSREIDMACAGLWI
jgi:hypothetical protein